MEKSEAQKVLQECIEKIENDLKDRLLKSIDQRLNDIEDNIDLDYVFDFDNVSFSIDDENRVNLDDFDIDVNFIFEDVKDSIFEIIEQEFKNIIKL